jgi:hypothetical protein
MRRLSTIAVLAIVAVLGSPGAASPRAADKLPTLYVHYTMNCTFSIVDDFGNAVTSIPPGTYQIAVSTPVMFKSINPQTLGPNDFTGCKGWVKFQLTGPGVNVSTSLDFGCDAFLQLPATLFKPNSTYTAQDLTQPAVAYASFATLASGSPAIPAGPSNTATHGSSQGDLVGSEINKTGLRGTIVGTLGASGKPTLTIKGKSVSTLKAGRYAFAVNDRDPKRGVVIRPVKGRSIDLSGTSFVGRRSTTVTLTAGRWRYYSDPGKASVFTVTG